MLKISGEALSGANGFGFDFEVVGRIAREVKTLVDMGVEVGLVAGESYIELGEEEAESLEKAIIEETDIHSNITVVQLVNERRLVADTDVGKQIRKDIVDLEQLLDAYRRGLLREKR